MSNERGLWEFKETQQGMGMALFNCEELFFVQSFLKFEISKGCKKSGFALSQKIGHDHDKLSGYRSGPISEVQLYSYFM